MSDDQFASEFLSSLQKLRSDRLFCDAVLTTDEGHGEIWAHRVVLATASARLCATLSSQMKASLAESGTAVEQRIRLPGCDLRAVEVVVSYLYSGKLVMPASFSKPEDFSGVLAVCEALNMDVTRLNGQRVTFVPSEPSNVVTLSVLSLMGQCEKRSTKPFRPTCDRQHREDEQPREDDSDADMDTCVDNDEDECSHEVKPNPDVDSALPGAKAPASIASSLADSTEIATTTASPLMRRTFKKKIRLGRAGRRMARKRKFEDGCDRLQKPEQSKTALDDPLVSRRTKDSVGRTDKSEFMKSEIRKYADDETVRDELNAETENGKDLLELGRRRNGRGRPPKRLERRRDDERSVEAPENGGTESSTAAAVDNAKRRRRYKPELEKFTCDLCQRRFRRIIFFKRHMATDHADRAAHMCDTCGNLFDSRDALDDHVPIHALIRRPARRGAAADLKRFQRRATDLEKFKCAVCRRLFLRLNFFKRHLAADHPDYRPHLCGQCGRIFEDRAALDAHVPLHAAGHPYICDLCGKGFNLRRYLRLHVLRHEGGPRPYLCDTCGKGFYEQSALDRHVLTWYSAVRPHTCSVCRKGYVSRTKLEEHELSHTSERRHICDVCGARYLSSAGLRTHRQLHTNGRPYVCPVCQRTFTQKYSLQGHMVLHSEEPRRTFQCHICGKGLSTQANLNAHTRTHLPPDPTLTCIVCNRTFKNRTGLLRHMTMHADLTHECPECGKKVRGAFRLALHRKGHVALRCRVCAKELMGTRALACHMIKYHPDSEHACDVCGRRFENARALYVHSRSHGVGEVLDASKQRRIGQQQCMGNDVTALGGNDRTVSENDDLGVGVLEETCDARAMGTVEARAINRKFRNSR